LRLATNVCINHLKKKRTPVVAIGEDDEASAPEPEAREPEVGTAAEQNETKAMLEDAIARLPDDYRLVVTLRHVEELSYDEIAETLGWPLGTVKVRLFRARERLREMLSPALGDAT
jgi:RNA polymerase sigma-70 factor (ECF subfamily)